jgi:hypothetical protein
MTMYFLFPSGVNRIRILKKRDVQSAKSGCWITKEGIRERHRRQDTSVPKKFLKIILFINPENGFCY